jgi:hypothetical protein
MKHIPYVYRLTDTFNGKCYIGSRYAKRCEPSDLGVTYFTSSKTVSALFKADPARFTTQIIVTGTREYVIKVEFDLIELHDAVMSDDFYNRTNAKGIHPDDNGGKKGGKRCSELGLIQALGRSGAGGRATAGMGYLKDAAKKLHSIKNENGKSVIAVRAGNVTASKPGMLAAAGRLGGLAAKASGQLLIAASAGGVKGGAKCKAEGLGICGLTIEDRKKWGSIGAALVGKMPWWVNLSTGETKRAVSQPEGFVSGRKIK